MDSDSVGENIYVGQKAWSFGDRVPESFAQHVSRSVPGYEEGHLLTVQLSDFFVKNDSTCYELGVSTGTLIKKLAKYHCDRGRNHVRWIGVDRELAMIERAELEIESFDPYLKNINLVVEDLKNFQFDTTDYVVSYYTIQFVDPRERQKLFDRIYEALNWGGAFVLFEKIRGSDARFQDILTLLYQDYKLSQGYTPGEILTKARSLKGVLEPFSWQGNLDLLKRAGFVDVQPVFQNICFQGILAIK